MGNNIRFKFSLLISNWFVGKNCAETSSTFPGPTCDINRRFSSLTNMSHNAYIRNNLKSERMFWPLCWCRYAWLLRALPPPSFVTKLRFQSVRHALYELYVVMWLLSDNRHKNIEMQHSNITAWYALYIASSNRKRDGVHMSTTRRYWDSNCIR